MKKSVILISAALIVCALAFHACEKDKTIEVTGISLSQTGSITLTIGDELPLAATVQPKDATNPKVSWASSDATTVSVADGKLKALKVGSAVITATAGKHSATVTVTVSPVKSVTIGEQDGDIRERMEDRANFYVDVTGIATGTAGSVTWYTSAAATATAAAPPGITAEASEIYNASVAMVVIIASKTVVQGEYYFRVTYDGVTSGVATLTVIEGPEQLIFVGQQKLPLTEGEPGETYYEVTVVFIDDGTWTVSVENLPEGVTLRNPDCLIEGGKTKIEFLTDASAEAGFHILTLTIAGVHQQFYLIIDAILPPRIVLHNSSSDSQWYFGVPPGGTISIFASVFEEGSSAVTERGLEVEEMRGSVAVINRYPAALGEGTGEFSITETNIILQGKATRFRAYADNAEKTGYTIWKLIPDGSADAPFLVSTAADLQRVGTGTAGWTLSSHYRQTASIYLTLLTNWTPIGSSQTSPFNGTYDGMGYSIADLTITTSDQYSGLFGYISGNTAAVRNVALISVNINSTGTETGGIAGYITSPNSVIENCYVTGSVKGGNYTGGITGNKNGGRIYNCYTECSVTGRSYTGGISGGSSSGTIQYCYATGDVSGITYLGGITGTNTNTSNTQNCVALNARISASSASTSTGRVIGAYAGTGTIAGNFARAAADGMTITANGVAITTESLANGIHGENVSSANYHGSNSGSWWNSNGGPNFSSMAWIFRQYGLPYLQNFAAEQKPQVNN